MGFTIDNNKYGHLLPKEDYFLQTDNIFCIADGITRDPVIPEGIITNTEEEKLEYYPNPSGASMAARAFCEAFIQFLNDKNMITEQDIKNAFIYANQKIKELNDYYIKNCDYLTQDYYACVASGCVIIDKKLYWGCICDCGIAIYDKNLKLKFRTADYMSNFNNYKMPEFAEKGLNWEEDECRQIIRKYYRNKPNKIVDNVLVSYGAITGEKEAEEFINIGKVELESDDVVILYSDGFEKAIYNENFIRYLFDNFDYDDKIIEYSKKMGDKEYNNYGKERTLIKVKVK